MEALDTDHAVKNVLFLQLPFMRLRVDLAVGQHALGPELEGLHGEGDAFKLLTDMDEIVDFVRLFDAFDRLQIEAQTASEIFINRRRRKASLRVFAFGCQIFFQFVLNYFRFLDLYLIFVARCKA